MARTKNKTKKRKRLDQKPDKTLGKKPDKTLGKKPNKKKPKPSKSHASDSESEPDKLQKLLEPYTKPQLIEFLCDAAFSNPSLLSRIKSTADSDISHRKIFVHGFGWDVTSETLLSSFSQYGDVEDCKVVFDRNTGKSKGFGFIVFTTRSAAVKALKQPQKKIKSRVAWCQLASVGPVGSNPSQDPTGRKIYVSNVHQEADPEKLHTFFAKFGEIESGPIGFDTFTGKSRGFALFVYKTQESARRVLEEPYKMFEGHQLHCQMATSKAKDGVPGPSTVQAPVLAAVAAAQNLALFNQNPALNPAFSALIANQNPGLMGGSPNPIVAPALDQAAMISSSNQLTGFGGHGASSHGSPSILGAYGYGSQSYGSQPYGSQSYGSQVYQSPHLGQSSSGRAYSTGLGGSYSGYPSYM
eukprot:TRINITY_DN10485_c0_g1_i1.p1 TRINITY_DN10485_c0_g1~~TRINITY_DN10485_c0_g1_i1.p1  ORF type:complete len:412 (+),score=22.94 TRINITY_DN10485_c0_g1_i1:76-1311(+)